jgi:hypothetical protein
MELVVTFCDQLKNSLVSPNSLRQGISHGILAKMGVADCTLFPPPREAWGRGTAKRWRGQLSVTIDRPLRCFAPPPPRNACAGEENSWPVVPCLHQCKQQT